ncbi:MAG: hypothetical protein F4Y97_09335 [Dehalococcoidia bacterium]|nr:hypothetical protein [Dehalococcoidia bacterium]
MMTMRLLRQPRRLHSRLPQSPRRPRLPRLRTPRPRRLPQPRRPRLHRRTALATAGSSTGRSGPTRRASTPRSRSPSRTGWRRPTAS